MQRINHIGRLSNNRIALSLLFCCLISGCNSQPHVNIEGGSTPIFMITGRGNIQVITVSGPDFAKAMDNGASGSRNMKPYWEIAPKSEYDLRRLEKLGGLVYGKVPDGFRQVEPANDAPPLPLPEDELLTFQLRVANSNGVGVRFVIHNKKPAVEGS